MLTPDRVPEIIRDGFSLKLDEIVASKFVVGQEIITKNIHPAGHTRLPLYARSKRGTIMMHHGVFPFPDSSAAGAGPNPQNVYCVRFSAPEIWGDNTHPLDAIYLDLWDDYLLSLKELPR